MIDLTGQKFGRLFILRKNGVAKNGHTLFLCMCDCGKEKTILGISLRSGKTKSCGCIRQETLVAMNLSRIKHGHLINNRTTKVYQTWNSLIQRCTNPKNPSYTTHGGRNISVCSRWKKFENFLEDMGEPPTDKHQIDRIDNNGNYCKLNCRWCTSTVNNRNKRNNRRITYNDKTQCLSEWAEEIDICRVTISNRLKRGWSIEKALTTPVRKREKTNE